MMTWTQVYDPLGHWWLSTLVAALPIVVLLGLLAGFKPFHAAALNLIANTAPVAWGAIGTPVHTLAVVTALPESDLNAMIGRILPFTAILVPFWLVRAMVSWSETFEVLPAILVVGLSFAGIQFFWSNYMDSNLVDIAAGVTSMVATVIFLRFWKPKRIWRFEDEREADLAIKTAAAAAPAKPIIADQMDDEWDVRKLQQTALITSHTGGQIAKAWLPFPILSVFVLVWGLPTIKIAMGEATTTSFKTRSSEVA